MKYKYQGILKNEEGIQFDIPGYVSNNLENIKEWARDRGQNYRLNIYNLTEDTVDYYKITKRRITLLHTDRCY